MKFQTPKKGFSLELPTIDGNVYFYTILLCFIVPYVMHNVDRTKN